MCTKSFAELCGALSSSKPIHPSTHPTPATHVFFFPLMLQTMAWFWEHRSVGNSKTKSTNLQCTPHMDPCGLSLIFCSHPPLLRTNHVDAATLTLRARNGRKLNVRHTTNKVLQGNMWSAVAVLPVEGTFFFTDICAFETKGVLYTSYCTC